MFFISEGESASFAVGKGEETDNYTKNVIKSAMEICTEYFGCPEREPNSILGVKETS